VQTDTLREGEELAFVFEFFRHGARSPIHNDETDRFKIPKGALTNSGMREHAVMGRFFRKRFVEDHNFLDQEYLQGQLHAITTHVDRTMKSGKSDMSGMFPPGTGDSLD